MANPWSALRVPLLRGYRRLLRSTAAQRSGTLRAMLVRRSERVDHGWVTLPLARSVRLRLDLGRGNQRRIFWSHEDYEPALQWILRELLPDGATMVDCGANAGLMGFLALAGSAGRVVFVEPHPRLAAQLRDNVERNGLGARASVVECAASDRAGPGVLYPSTAEQDGSHALTPNKYSDPAADALTVRRRRLDEILAEHGLGRVDLLKIDAEHHDREVLSGLGDWLAPERIEMIYVEMSGAQFEPVFELLAAAGYVPFGTSKLKKKQRGPRAAAGAHLLHPYRDDSRRRDLLWCAPAGTAHRRLGGGPGGEALTREA
jgi:FkbM family methyltransferase